MFLLPTCFHSIAPHLRTEKSSGGRQIVADGFQQSSLQSGLANLMPSNSILPLCRFYPLHGRVNEMNCVLWGVRAKDIPEKLWYMGDRRNFW